MTLTRKHETILRWASLAYSMFTCVSQNAVRLTHFHGVRVECAAIRLSAKSISRNMVKSHWLKSVWRGRALRQLCDSKSARNWFVSRHLHKIDIFARFACERECLCKFDRQIYSAWNHVHRFGWAKNPTFNTIYIPIKVLTRTHTSSPMLRRAE